MKFTKIKMLTAIFIVLIVAITPHLANATFSIVAVDTTNGAIGGAGGTCGAGALILNDLIEGIGAIHTQSYYNPQNQQNAHDLMVAGLTPDSIITWLYTNDIDGNPNIRQYVVVTVAGPGNSAAYSGSLNPQHQHQVYGPGYAIAGNQLLSQDIVTNMETAFLSTDGELEDKLMAALQAANVPGADSECLPDDLPAKSAFIRVCRPGDGATLYLEKNVNYTYSGNNPIDSLQVLFDSWKSAKYADADVSTVGISDEYIDVNCPESSLITITPVNYEGQAPLNGIDSVLITNNGSAIITDVINNGDGSYEAVIYEPAYAYIDTITVNVFGDGYNTELTNKPIVDFYLNGDANSDVLVNILDVVFLINFLYDSGPAPVPPERSDPNATGNINILDITYLIANLYNGGPGPICPL